MYVGTIHVSWAPRVVSRVVVVVVVGCRGIFTRIYYLSAINSIARLLR